MSVRLADATLPDGSRADLRIEHGRITAIDPAGRVPADADPPGTARIQLGGALVVPAFVDGHIHLDKTLVGLPWLPHLPGDTVAKRIAAEKALRRTVDMPMETRAVRLVEQVAAAGTGTMRCHVDVDAEIGLAGLHALLHVREQVQGLADIQLVAFPQSGVVSHPGAADLLDAAIVDGADLVGGLDPAGIDGDVEGQLDIVFGIAERRGVGIDLHLHDPGPLGTWQLQRIAQRAASLGMAGQVAISHAFCLGDVDEDEFGRTAEALAAGGVAIMTNGPGPVPMPPVARLHAAGVTVFAGSDNIRDAWSPYGNGDMLERAMMIGYRAGLLSDEDLRLAFDLATTHAARVLGLANYGVAVGAAADLVAVPARNVAEAVATKPPRRLVMKAGRVVARDGHLVAAHAPEA